LTMRLRFPNSIQTPYNGFAPATNETETCAAVSAAWAPFCVRSRSA
jgi:hypothetical protein